MLIVSPCELSPEAILIVGIFLVVIGHAIESYIGRKSK